MKNTEYTTSENLKCSVQIYWGSKVVSRKGNKGA